jgi:UDP-glucose 4-epimerase
LRILVLGGAGYIGSTSVEAFLAAGHDVVVYDDLSTGHGDAVPEKARLVRGTIQDRARLETLLRDERIDAVLHCAAKSLVGESMADPALYYRHNVTGGVAMLEAMHTAGVTRLVYSSTAAVYGEPRRVPIAEADRTEPINPYGATKLAFEGAMRWFAASHDFRAISLRYFNVAGATERNGEDHTPETHLIPLVLRVAAGEASHVQIFGQDYPTPDGTCIRDFVHVRDLAAGHLLALEATGEGDPSLEVYNLGSAAGFSVREVVEAARKVTGRAIPARVLKRRSGDPPVLVASSRRARRELGWHPEHSKLDEMLTDAWDWRLAHPDGYASKGTSGAAAHLIRSGKAPEAAAESGEAAAEQESARAAASGGGGGGPLSELPALS